MKQAPPARREGGAFRLTTGPHPYTIPTSHRSMPSTPTPPAAPAPTPILGEGARTLLTAASAFIVIYGLKYTREFSIPIVMAAFLAIISYPITILLRRGLRLPHWLAVIFTVAVDFGLISAIVWMVKFLAKDLVATLHGDFMQQVEQKFITMLAQLDQWGLGGQMREMIGNESPQAIISQVLDLQKLISTAQSITGSILSFMSVTVLVLILMTFMLGDAPLFERNVASLPNSPRGKAQVYAALQGIQRYLLIKTIASISTGLLAFWLCRIMDIPFAFLWGFIACVLNYIPTIGSIAAAVPPILLALLLGDWSSVFITTGGYLAINFAIGNGIEPLFLGKQFGIATTVVILSVIVWGWVWGPIGMFLAVPFTVLTKLLLENSQDFSWIATIIADKPTGSSTPPTSQP